MCVIVHVPSGVAISEETLKDCYTANQHGWGLMAVKDGDLFYRKDVTPFAEFIKVWNELPIDSDRFAHFRIKTSGLINADMCHPFPVTTADTDALLMHNGVFTIPELHPDKSDTWHMARLIEGVHHSTTDFLTNEDFIKSMKKVCTSSKTVFLTKDKRVIKFGDWKESDGCFFSNLYWKCSKNWYTGGHGGTYSGSKISTPSTNNQNSGNLHTLEKDSQRDNKNDSTKGQQKILNGLSNNRKVNSLINTPTRGLSLLEATLEAVDSFTAGELSLCVHYIQQYKIPIDDLNQVEPGFSDTLLETMLTRFKYPVDQTC